MAMILSLRIGLVGWALLGRLNSAVRRPVRLDAAPDNLAWARAAARTTSINSTADSWRNSRTAIRGLVTTSTAPSSRACNPMLVFGPVSAEQMTTGSGSSRIIFCRKVMPSMRGRSRSKTMTSGRCCFILFIAIKGSLAVATAMPGSKDSIAVSTSRTTAESSTTNT